MGPLFNDMILDIAGILISSDIISECFCCDLQQCKGQCCVEGDAGAPVSMDEVGDIEEVVEAVWDDLSASAQAVIDRQGVAYVDRDGDLVTSIVGGRDCVFTCYQGDICLCALEKASLSGRIRAVKPISCSLYPIREKRLSDGSVALNYNRWDVCADAVRKGREDHTAIYQFLREPLIRRFGQEWYDELCEVAEELSKIKSPL